MRSTFMGLETSKRGLYTQQTGLYTTGHNLSNANTLGYSRQRVNMQATAGFPGVGLNAPTMPGFLGTGVAAGSIQRIRDSFVDHQYRQESNKLGYWESRSKAISQMEDVLNEPSHYGLQKALAQFWESLEDLAAHPENGGARDVVIERGKAVADSFHYMNKSLTEIQASLGQEIGVTDKNINSLLEQIADLNRQIKEIEPNGYMPNDLYDARDVLLDQLSEYVPIEISYEQSGGRALPIAEGSVTVKLKLESGILTLVEGNKFGSIVPTNATVDGFPPDAKDFEKLTITLADGSSREVEIEELRDTGKLRSLIDSYGYNDGTNVKGLYPEMLAQLDKLAQEFADKFNELHKDGSPLDSTKTKIDDFFEAKGGGTITAANIIVNQEIIDDPSRINASSADDEEGNGKNALILANMQFDPFIGGSTVQTYFQGMIGKLGVDGQQAAKLAFNTQTLRDSVEHRRNSISSVSLDEEMTDMIRFQQAYNASARMITVVDETLDKIINGMGRVGL